MPIYFFNLHTPNSVVRDPSGTDLPDEGSARAHALAVARELMRHREAQTRSWQLFVSDSEGREVFQTLLATADESLERFSPELRSSMEAMHAQSASLSDTIRSVHHSILRLQGTMARAEGAPYLAAIGGLAIDRDATKLSR
jgi:hypothetical protein